MLKIQQPTANTTLYTISTKTPARSIAAHALLVAGQIIRPIALACALAILWTEIELLGDSGHSHILPHISAFLGSINIAPQWQETSSRTIWSILLCLVGLWIAFRRAHTEETILVVQGVGVQTSTSSASYLLPSTTRFIPTTAIQDIFIHEAFTGFKVGYYLCIVVEKEAQVVVVFPVVNPT